MSFSSRLQQAMDERDVRPADLSRMTGIGEGAISQYRKGAYKAGQRNLEKIAVALGVSIQWLMGIDSPDGFPAPLISDDVVTMPVIGDMAAGFEHIAAENWSGDTICIPQNYLHGRPASDYIVLNVCGDSMYPFYLDGDKVLVLRTPALEYSGQVALVRYDGEMATLKKVEYHPGDDKMKLIPANPLYQPREITGSDLDQCSIIGIPKLVIREV